MSLQSVLFRVMVQQRRALVRADGSLMGSVPKRHCINLQSRQRWLSTTSKDDYSWEAPVEPLEQQLRNERTETEVDESAADRDRLLREMRRSIHDDMEIILNNKPGAKKKWSQILQRRRKERQRKSLFSAPQSDSDGMPRLKTTVDAPGEMRLTNMRKADLRTEDTLTSTKPVESILSKGRPKDTGQSDAAVQPVSTSQGALTWGNDKTISEEKFIIESTWVKTETSISQSFLELLHQPIEDQALAKHEEGNAAHVPESSTVQMPSSQPSSLLDLLNDADTFISSIDMQKENDNGMQSSSEATTIPDSARTEPASLMDLLNDERIVFGVLSESNKEEGDGEKAPIEEESAPTGSMSDRHSSLLDSQDDDTVDIGTGGEEPGTSWFTDDSIERRTADDNVGHHDTEEHDSSAVIDEGLALLLTLKGRDWSRLEQVHEDEDGIISPQDDGIVEEIVPESEIKEEELEMETDYDTTKEMTSHEEYHNERINVDWMLENVEELFEEAAFGELSLSTTDYNALLVRIATSTLQTDEVVALMLKVYRLMSELVESGAECSPDATTYTILMVTLDRRANALLSAADACRQLIDSGVELSSEAMFHGMSCLERTSNITDMERLMNLILNQKTYQVPMWAWMSLLRVYKNENAQQKALDLLDKCIEMNGDRNVRTVTNLVLETISWPRKDRGGCRIDRSSLLTGVLDKLETVNSDGSVLSFDEVVTCGGQRITASYNPPFHVWKRLITLLETEVDYKSNTGWDVVHRAFKSMRNAVEDFWPDNSLLKIGLDAAQVSGDAELAVDLILRMYNKQMNESESFEPAPGCNDDVVGARDSLNVSDSGSGDQYTVPSALSEPLDHAESDFSGSIDNLSEAIGVGTNPVVAEADNGQDHHEFADTTLKNSIRVPLQAFTAAMHVCVATGSTDNLNRLLDSIRDSRNTLPLSIKNELYTLALKGYAKVGDSDAAQALLVEMRDGGLSPTEEAYGAVIHSLAVASKTDKACELFEAIASGRFEDDISPGISCYNARMLAHVEAHEWDKALACHEERKNAGIPWSSASLQDVLLAHYRSGQKEKALATIEEALESKMKMDYSCCALSLQILLGDVLESKNIDEARHKLREIGEQNHDLKTVSLNLNRSLRVAEVEEKRQPTKGLKQAEITARRDEAWHTAHRHLVDFARAIEIAEDSKASSST